MSDDHPKEKKKSKKKSKGPTVAELQAELEDLDQENEELMNYVATLEQELTNAGECLRQADEDMTSLKRELAGSRMDLDTSQAQLVEIERKHAKHTEDLEDETKKLRATVDAAKDESSQTKAQNESLRQELAKVRADAAGLQVIVDGLKSDRLKSEEARAKKKQEKRASANTGSDETAKLKSDIVDLSAQNAALTKEVQSLKEAQVRAETAIASLTADKTAQATVNKEVQHKLDLANKESALLVKAKADEVERVRAAERNLTEARDKAEGLVRELNALKTRYEELDRQYKQSQSALALAQAAAMEQIAGSAAGASLGLAPSNVTKNPSVSAAERAARRSSRMSTSFNAEMRQPSVNRVNLASVQPVGEDRSPTTQERLVSPRGLNRAYSKNEAAFKADTATEASQDANTSTRTTPSVRVHEPSTSTYTRSNRFLGAAYNPSSGTTSSYTRSTYTSSSTSRTPVTPTGSAIRSSPFLTGQISTTASSSRATAVSPVRSGNVRDISSRFSAASTATTTTSRDRDSGSSVAASGRERLRSRSNTNPPLPDRSRIK